jgi:hypothetical protein
MRAQQKWNSVHSEFTRWWAAVDSGLVLGFFRRDEHFGFDGDELWIDIDAAYLAYKKSCAGVCRPLALRTLKRTLPKTPGYLGFKVATFHLPEQRRIPAFYFSIKDLDHFLWPVGLPDWNGVNPLMPGWISTRLAACRR